MTDHDLKKMLRKFYTNLTPRSEILLTRLRHCYLGIDEAYHLDWREAMA